MLVVFALLAGGRLAATAQARQPTPSVDAKAVALSFRGPVDGGFTFDTGALKGVLRQAGRSRGVGPVVDSVSGAGIAGDFGLLSHYRLLDDHARYGHAAWDWKSAAVSPSGKVAASFWDADADHPFALSAAYGWSAPDTLDVTTRVTAHRDLRRFEVFLASYFRGFPKALAYVRACPETGGKAGLLEARREAGDWQMFPRDEAAVSTINDGRWQRPPNPVAWKIRPTLAGPLAVRRDPASGLTALVMAPPGDCFAVSMPFGEEGHRSLYFSLLGRDLKAGESAVARTRLIVRRGLTDAQAIALYEAYVKPVGAVR
jgi:hypothetical protein